MPLPDPEPGLVIRHAYLWHRQADAGQTEEEKDRPAVIVVAVSRPSDHTVVVTVLPITHSPPNDPRAGLEIPQPVKRHLALDADRSWVMVDEGNQFVWPGYDLRPIPGTGEFAYGFLPPGFFRSVMSAFANWYRAHRPRLIARD